ncbi:MAG: hypothetical protein LBD01_01650 [Puniceicoccales bacterium]|jgi:hypothetical protein|nr:hypothetical protein [Puniceicoccales bacterium]
MKALSCAALIAIATVLLGGCESRRPGSANMPANAPQSWEASMSSFGGMGTSNR